MVQAVIAIKMADSTIKKADSTIKKAVTTIKMSQSRAFRATVPRYWYRVRGSV